MAERARATLAEICDYIAVDDREAANRLVLRIDQKISRLREFPHMGSPVANGLRKLSVRTGPYIIRYRVLTGHIVIVDIRHMARR